MSSLPSAAELLDGIRRWVEIESHTSDLAGVERMAAEVERAYQASGFSTERIPGRDGYGDHLIARAPWHDGRPGILVMSHLDTVHPKGTLEQFPFRIEGDSAFGPGIYDMKGGAHIAFRAITAGEVPHPVTHLFTTDEEVGSPTSRDLIRRLGSEATYVLVTEPAREGGKVVTARKGVARWTIKAIGRPAHAGSRHADGRNAIVEMAKQVARLTEMTDYERDITINVGLIEGGTGANVVPAECWIRVDNRLPNMAAAEEMEARITGLKPFDPDIRLEFTGGLDRPPYEKSETIEILFQHAKSLAAEIGWPLEDLKTGGCSDGNFTAALTPTLDGLGVDGKGGHTDYEQLYISSLQPRCRLMRRLLETLD
ncbi:MAG: M20 family metallopeptidase [Geminicoccaceae bacterium]